MFQYINSLLKFLTLDKNEKNFIKRSNKVKKSGHINLEEEYIILQTPLDYYYLLFFKSLIKDNNLLTHKIYGLNPYVINKTKLDKDSFIKRKDRISDFLPYTLANFIAKLLYYIKIKKLYKSIGFSKILNFDTSIKRFVNNKIQAQILFNSIKNKKKILKLRYKQILIGDLVYDTYLRWRAKPTVDIKDEFLKEIIFLSIVMIENLNSFFIKKKIKFYITSFTSYIHHGIPVRFFLKKKIPVYSVRKLHFEKNIYKLSSSHYLNGLDFSNLNKKIKLIKKTEFKFAKKNLERKFTGQLENSSKYLRLNPYQNNFEDVKLNNIDGVLFLHDFYDSPHAFEFKLFEDIYEWAIFTFKLIRKHNLKIGIKQHPNTHPTIKNYMRKLKKEFSDLIWIDHSISNFTIFKKKNIKFGMSIAGSVIYEMAYFNKIPISVGVNHFSSFSFMRVPKTKKEYIQLILNYNQIKLPKNIKEIVIKLYYELMYRNKNISDFKLSNIDDLKNINSDSSKDLLRFSKKLFN